MAAAVISVEVEVCSGPVNLRTKKP